MNREKPTDTNECYVRNLIRSLEGKKIRSIETVKGGNTLYYRFWLTNTVFFDVHQENIFDRDGMRFEDNTEIPF